MVGLAGVAEDGGLGGGGGDGVGVVWLRGVLVVVVLLWRGGLVVVALALARGRGVVVDVVGGEGDAQAVAGGWVRGAAAAGGLVGAGPGGRGVGGVTRGGLGGGGAAEGGLRGEGAARGSLGSLEVVAVVHGGRGVELEDGAGGGVQAGVVGLDVVVDVGAVLLQQQAHEVLAQLLPSELVRTTRSLKRESHCL